jgi:glycosyltransferase involved in cell wall biosynthesis
MEKLLIIYNKIWPYRVKIFELLNEVYEVTVTFSDPKFIGKKYRFKTLYMPGKNIGPFFVHSDNVHKIARNYDAIIGLYDIRWIKLMILSLLPFRKYSISYWGIGVTASYKNKFDSKSKWDAIRYFFARKADSIILYSDYPIKKHIQHGLKKEKLFVANNTTDVYFDENGFDPEKKQSFLFVGTLYPQKGFDVLIDAYLSLVKKHNNIPQLEIVGDGPERERLQAMIRENEMDKLILLHGAVFDPKELSVYYNRALACVSPNQAGLSVLTSMGNATIFVTERNAITGGEIFNIKNKINGIIYQGGSDQLAVVMEWLMLNKKEVIKMSIEARHHYSVNRTPVQMAKSIVDAVNFRKR